MDVSRRDVVKAAGMTAAAVGLSAVACGSEEQASDTRDTTVTTEERPCEHTVEIKGCGQYVVVESSNPCDGEAEPLNRRRAFKGRVEARRGDGLVFKNLMPTPISLYFPEPRIFVNGLKGGKEVMVDTGGQLPLRLSEEAGEGVYEYAVLYMKTTQAGLKPPWDSSEWGFAIGGSSPVIDIRI
jgi:hypothetical protein